MTEESDFEGLVSEVISGSKKNNALTIPNKEGNVWPRQYCPAFTPRRDSSEELTECWYCVYADFHLKNAKPLEVGICYWPRRIIGRYNWDEPCEVKK